MFNNLFNDPLIIKLKRSPKYYYKLITYKTITDLLRKFDQDKFFIIFGICIFILQIILHLFYTKNPSVFYIIIIIWIAFCFSPIITQIVISIFEFLYEAIFDFILLKYKNDIDRINSINLQICYIDILFSNFLKSNNLSTLDNNKNEVINALSELRYFALFVQPISNVFKYYYSIPLNITSTNSDTRANFFEAPELSFKLLKGYIEKTHVELTQSVITQSNDVFINTEKSKEINTYQEKNNLSDLSGINLSTTSRIISENSFNLNNKWGTIQTRKLEEIGKMGEEIVLFNEHLKIQASRPDKLSMLIHASNVFGDNLGYDIESWDEDQKIYIEVKTTTGNLNNFIYLSRNEYHVAMNFDKQYQIHIVYNLKFEPLSYEIYIVKGFKDILNKFEIVENEYYLLAKDK